MEIPNISNQYYKILIVVYNSKEPNSITFKSKSGSHKIKKKNQYLKKEREYYKLGWSDLLRYYSLNKYTEKHILIKIKEDKTGIALTIYEIDYMIRTITCYVEDIFVDLIKE